MKWRDLRCGEVRPEHVGKRLILSGWVDTRRDHGGLVFIDLRDRAGICQLVINPERALEAHAVMHEIRNEFVLRAEGEVVARATEAVNPELPTGEVELQVDTLEIVSRCPRSRSSSTRTTSTRRCGSGTGGSTSVARGSSATLACARRWSA